MRGKYSGTADLTGDWRLPFIGSVGLLLLGAALAPFMHPERPFVEQEALTT